MQMIEIEKLKNHPRNHDFFDDITGDRWKDFKESIIRQGVVEAIVTTQDLTIVSGHQRAKACKELGLLTIPCIVKHYPDVDERLNRTKDDMVLEDLISTNIMQRGVGNVNPMKMAKCIVELERIYGIKRGNNQNSLPNNSASKTQTDLAEQMGIKEDTLQNYKKLTTLIPELQQMVENGSMKATVGYKIWAKMPQEEQEKFFNEIGKEKIKTMTQKATEKYIEENNKLKTELEKEKNKPKQKEYIETVIDNTDYETINKIKNELDQKEKELLKINNKQNLLEQELYIYKQDSLEYEQFKNDIEALTQTKEDLGRQINGIKETTILVNDIDDFLKNKLAPIKYSKSILDCKDEEIVIENLSEIVNMVQEWCYEIKNVIPNLNKNNFVEGVVIE